MIALIMSRLAALRLVASRQRLCSCSRVYSSDLATSGKKVCCSIWPKLTGATGEHSTFECCSLLPNNNKMFSFSVLSVAFSSLICVSKLILDYLLCLFV